MTAAVSGDSSDHLCQSETVRPRARDHQPVAIGDATDAIVDTTRAGGGALPL